MLAILFIGGHIEREELKTPSTIYAVSPDGWIRYLSDHGTFMGICLASTSNLMTNIQFLLISSLSLVPTCRYLECLKHMPDIKRKHSARMTITQPKNSLQRWWNGKLERNLHLYLGYSTSNRTICRTFCPNPFRFRWNAASSRQAGPVRWNTPSKL